ncbi:hypothetical protein FACS1894172_04630 [Spirochaetia bacterium]|nr:hypothetical protein FACS1894164_12670 [Spirochaetia bacterium]GHU30795.1 hypothetical protein FACS1894172_04630 [Spirochaetia bacterium]
MKYTIVPLAVLIVLCACSTKKQPDIVQSGDAIIIAETPSDPNPVFYVSDSGSDDNDGKKVNTPFRTLKKALSQLKTGSTKTIFISGTLTAATEGSSGSPAVFTIKDSGDVEIVISGVPGAGPTVLSGTGTDSRILSISGTSRIRIQNIEISGGHSDESGGAIILTGGASLHVGNNAQIINNTAAVDGGAIFVGKGSKLSIAGGVISNNKSESMLGGGGGIFLEEGSTATMNAGTISSNTVTGILGRGGGIFIDRNASFNITGGAITGNRSEDSGGGVYVVDSGLFNFDQFVTGNSAPTSPNIYREVWQ